MKTNKILTLALTLTTFGLVLGRFYPQSNTASFFSGFCLSLGLVGLIKFFVQNRKIYQYEK